MSSVELDTLYLAMATSETDQDRVQWSYLRYIGTGVEFFSAVAILTFLGIFLDGKFGIAPILTIVFSLLGFAAATWNLIRNVNHIERMSKNSGGQK